MKIVQLSDTHLSHLGGAVTENFQKIARFINEELKPTFVVHSGDVLMLDPDNSDDRAIAKDLMRLIEAPMRVVPGNHDVGEGGDNPWAGFSATSERTQAFTHAFGDDHWTEIIGEYALVGLNSEILNTGILEEDEQWEWLESLASEVGERPVIVFSHKAFWPPAPGEHDHAMSIPAASLDRLMAIFGDLNVKAFGSAHLHHYHVGQEGDAITVSAPSTAFTSSQLASLPGLDQLGVVEYVCENGQVKPFFRALPDLIEGDATEIQEFNTALSELGMTL